MRDKYRWGHRRNQRQRKRQKEMVAQNKLEAEIETKKMVAQNELEIEGEKKRDDGTE